jgi:hypothetical protein
MNGSQVRFRASDFFLIADGFLFSGHSEKTPQESSTNPSDADANSKVHNRKDSAEEDYSECDGDIADKDDERPPSNERHEASDRKHASVV